MTPDALLREKRQHIRQLIKDAVNGRPGDEWNRVAVVVLDTTTPRAKQIASRLGEASTWADDGRIASYVTSRELLVELTPKVFKHRSVGKKVAAAPAGALVLCITEEGIGVECMSPNPVARALVDGLWDRLDACIEEACVDLGASWGDLGVILGAVADPYASEILVALSGHRPLSDSGALFVVLHKEALLDLMRKHGSLDEVTAAMERTPGGAYVWSIGGPDDMIAAVKLEPIEPPDKKDVEAAIAAHVDYGLAASWEEVGVCMVDTRGAAGRDFVTELKPGMEFDGGNPWVVFLSKREELRDALVSLGMPTAKRGKGAMVVMLGPNNQAVVTHMPKPAQLWKA